MNNLKISRRCELCKNQMLPEEIKIGLIFCTKCINRIKAINKMKLGGPNGK